MNKNAQGSLLTNLGSIAGLLSFFLVVVQANLPTLTEQQRWGLASLAAVSVWGFIFASHVRLVQQHTEDESAQRIWGALLGTIAAVALLFFILPFLRFQLPSEDHEVVPVVAGALYLATGVFWTGLLGFKKLINS